MWSGLFVYIILVMVFIHLSIVLKCVKCLNNVSIIFVEKCGMGLTLYNYVLRFC